MSKEEILVNGKMDKRLLTYAPESIKHIYSSMDQYAEQECNEFLKWVIDQFTTDEDRLPISSNTTLGGMTVFIAGNEYPITKLHKLFIESKTNSHPQT